MECNPSEPDPNVWRLHEWHCSQDSVSAGTEWAGTLSADDQQACAQRLDMLWRCYLTWFEEISCEDYAVASTDDWECQPLYEQVDDLCGGVTMEIYGPQL